MKIILFCFMFVIIQTSTFGNTFEFDGSGDLKPAKPTVPDLSQRIREAFHSKSMTLQVRDRTKTRVKRIVRTVLPGLVKSYLDFHLPEFVHLYVGEFFNSEDMRDLFRSNDVIPTSCHENEAKIENLVQEIGQLKERLNFMGNRMDELERIVDDYGNALKHPDPEPRNKTFLETDKTNENIQLDASSNDATLQQDTASVLEVTPAPNISCVKPYLPRRNVSSSSNTESSSRVLTVSINSPQFYILDDGKRIEFPLRSEKVRSVTFDPTTGHVIWSNYSSGYPGIFSARLKKPRKIKRLSAMSSEGMAVDPCKRWLFFTTIAPRPTISRMTTKGRHYRRIKNMKKYGPYMYSVAVDPDKELIYTCHQSVLLETSYDGKQQRELVSEGAAIFAVTLDLPNRMLFYGAWGEIRRMSLSDGANETIAKVASSPRNLAYHDNFLYRDKGKLIQVLDVSTKTTFDLGKVNGTLSLCLIP